MLFNVKYCISGLCHLRKYILLWRIFVICQAGNPNTAPLVKLSNKTGLILKTSGGAFESVARWTDCLYVVWLYPIQGTQAAMEAGVGNVINEPDAVEVVQAVCSSSHRFSVVTNLITELRRVCWFFISVLGYFNNAHVHVIR